MSNQITLKPQDLVVLLKLASRHHSGPVSFHALGESIELSASATHAAVRRARAARLLHGAGLGLDNIDRSALRAFVVHGARYAFPASVGPMTHGLPTAHAAAPLKDRIGQSTDPPPVWPSPGGQSRGLALYPLYPSVPSAAMRDPDLYELLALFDAVRSGNAREHNLARQLLTERLS